MLDDNYISNLFFGKRQLKYQIYNEYLQENESEIYQYVMNRFDDSESFKESIYRIRYRIEKRPVCEECGSKLKFRPGEGKDIFTRFCCKKCANNNELSKAKLKETCKEKYGVSNVAKSTYFKETYIKHIQEKYQDTKITNAFQAKEVIDKIKETSLRHWGVTNYGATKEHQIRLRSKNVIYKREQTKRKKHTFNTSIPETESYKLLKEKYHDMKYQYKSDLYPFSCDFYIPSLDLYIECNYHWTHGGKPYEGTNEDIDKVNEWKEKHTKYYDNAICTWTIRDVKKREIAKDNNLHYLEFWKIEELKGWISNA